MKEEMVRVDQLIADAAAGRLSRRDLVKRATALGLGAPMTAALLNAATAGPVSAQEPVTLNFDAGATGGGGGKPNAGLVNYCYIVNGGNQFELNRMVDARLVTLSADLQGFVGDLAESWDVAGTTATFQVRQNAMWHDGTPLTANDVVFTINVLTDPASNSRWGNAFSSVVGYEEAQSASTPTSLSGVTAPDDYTVQIELTQPDSGMLAGFFFINILPEHILSSVERAALPEQPFWTEGRIGAGPFKFIQLVEGERLELEAFPEYHHGAPRVDCLNLLFFTSFETSLAAFQAGDSLAAPLTANDVQVVEETEGAEIVTTPAGVAAIWINTEQPEFSDKRVRQAISYAIDRQTVTETLFQGYANPVATEIPYLEWAQPADANPYTYDPERAMQLLEEAGWTGEQTFTLWYYYPDQVTATVMEAIQQYLAAVGINVELRFDDASGVRQQEMDEGTWYLVYGSYGAQPAPANLSVIWGCQSQETWTYCNPDFDAAMEAALRTYDQEEQAQHYQEAIRILNDELPWVWLFDRQNLIAVSNNLTTGATPAWGPGHIMYANHAYDWTVSE